MVETAVITKSDYIYAVQGHSLMIVQYHEDSHDEAVFSRADILHMHFCQWYVEHRIFVGKFFEHGGGPSLVSKDFLFRSWKKSTKPIELQSPRTASLQVVESQKHSAFICMYWGVMIARVL